MVTFTIFMSAKLFLFSSASCGWLLLVLICTTAEISSSVKERSISELFRMIQFTELEALSLTCKVLHVLLWAGLSRIVLDLLRVTSSLVYMYGIREVSEDQQRKLKIVKKPHGEYINLL